MAGDPMRSTTLEGKRMLVGSLEKEACAQDTLRDEGSNKRLKRVTFRF